MNERDVLARRFEAHRPHLHGVAYRMLSPEEDFELADSVGWRIATRWRRWRWRSSMEIQEPQRRAGSHEISMPGLR